MKKLPKGISNFEELIKGDYYYVDKTEYIEKLENLADKRVMFLRPRKFGKTLFTSMLECYYDINKKDQFDELFKNTYIGKNPTENKNKYCILRFNFSGIDTSNCENTIKGFKEESERGIKNFITLYNMDFYINIEQTPEGMLRSFFDAFKIQRKNQKIYVIIDEYDHFANELLSFDTENFKNLISQNGKVRKWYEALKIGTESVVERIFITGVAPITLDSLTSGFNIEADLTMKKGFNEMLGFTENELLQMMDSQEIDKKEQKSILPVMKENYDGYKFSEDAENQLYNSNMCLYFLNEYAEENIIPKNLVDINISSDYSKVEKMLNLCKVNNRVDIIKKSLSEEGIETDITQKFNVNTDFTQDDMLSMLFYLGYLTIIGERYDYPVLKVPNNVMKNEYLKYYSKVIDTELGGEVTDESENIFEELSQNGKIDKVTKLVHKHLNSLSNRDYTRFDERYIKLEYSLILSNLKEYNVLSEYEVNRKYMDLLILPKDETEGYYSVLIEFKYLKKADENLLEETKRQAKEQITQYSNLERIKNIPKLKKYTIVAIVDELYVDEIE